MPESWDLVVIGTGAGAAAAAYKCRAAGWEVAIVDDRPFGGTCALRGCDPKKVLVGAAEVQDWQHRMHGRGIAGNAHVAWKELMAFKRSFTEPVPVNREEGFRKEGIHTFHGTARFTGATTLEVDGTSLETRHVLVAAGARPRTLDMPGEDLLITSTDFLNLDTLPERLVFVGGGYISFEFAHIAARAGAEVTILHRSTRPLNNFDPDLVDRLIDATREIGVDVRLGTPVDRVERDGDALVVHAGTGETFTCDAAVHGAGRVPKLDDLNLDAGNVKHDKRGVIVDDHLQSVTNDAVYAAGDAAASPGWPLTPIAAMESHVAASNMLDGNTRKPDYTGTASIAFTTPPLARVGYLEEQAREEGHRVRVESGSMSEWFTSRRVNEHYSGYKVVIDADSGFILGAHLLGAHVEDVINLFGLAIRHGIPADALKRMPFGYPTRTSDVPYML